MKIMSSPAYKIMEVELLLQIQKKYQKCPFCGSNYSKEKDVFSIHEDGIFERKCMCGYEISGHIDINGIIEKDYNESCAKNDFLMEIKEGSLLHNDARGLLIQYPSVGNDTQFWLTAIKIKKTYQNYMELEDLFRNIINDLSKCNNSLTFFDTNFLQAVVDRDVWNLHIISELIKENKWGDKTDQISGSLITKENVTNFIDRFHYQNVQYITSLFSLIPMKNIGEDPEIIEIMIDYGCYQYIPEKYRNDKKLTIRGIQQNKKSVQFMGDDLRKDFDFVLMVIKNYGKEIYAELGDHFNILSYVDESLQKNKKLIKENFKRNGYTLSDAPLYIQKDKNFCKQLYTAAAGYKGRGSDVPSAFSREELTDKDERKQLLKGILQRGEIEKFSYDEVLQAVAELEDEEADY